MGKRPALLGLFGKKASLNGNSKAARVVEQRPATDQGEGAGRKEYRNT
jgi:hypothetical protein